MSKELEKYNAETQGAQRKRREEKSPPLGTKGGVVGDFREALPSVASSEAVQRRPSEPVFQPLLFREKLQLRGRSRLFKIEHRVDRGFVGSHIGLRRFLLGDA